MRNVKRDTVSFRARSQHLKPQDNHTNIQDLNEALFSQVKTHCRGEYLSGVQFLNVILQNMWNVKADSGIYLY